MEQKSNQKKKYKVGMYGGKFMPFHKGHLHCVEYAASQCEQLYVLLFVGGDEELAILKTRHENWLQPNSRLKHIKKACKQFDNVIVKQVDITDCKYPDGTENWDMETERVLSICGPLDAVYGSEPHYGDYFKRAYPNATFEVIDKDRKAVPISGTMVRSMNEEERKKWIV